MYVREGSTNTRADPATIAELRRQAASQSFDLEAIPSVAGSDLDQVRLNAAFSGTLSPSKLQTLGIACQQEIGGSVKVTVPVHPHYAASPGERVQGAQRRSREASDRRRAILELLSRQGEASTAEVAAHIGLTTRATRDWLHRLEADDEVAATDHPLNSPQRRWTLPVTTGKPRKATRKSS